MSLPFGLYSLSAQARCSPLALRATLDLYRATEEQSAAFLLVRKRKDTNGLDYGDSRLSVLDKGQQILMGIL